MTKLPKPSNAEAFAGMDGDAQGGNGYARAFSQANPPPLTVRHFIRCAFPRRQTAALSSGSKGFSYPRSPATFCPTSPARR